MPAEKYEYGVDFDAIDAIDIHTHVEVDCHGHQAYDDVLVAATAKYFKMASDLTASVDAVADYYRQRNTAAVGSPSTLGTGCGTRPTRSRTSSPVPHATTTS